MRYTVRWKIRILLLLIRKVLIFKFIEAVSSQDYIGLIMKQN